MALRIKGTEILGCLANQRKKILGCLANSGKYFLGYLVNSLLKEVVPADHNGDYLPVGNNILTMNALGVAGVTWGKPYPDPGPAGTQH
ncbi:hypothetical protein RCH21_000689 [Arthrobacter sp. PL16]|uniref:hypothetical protein n=1 Tax=Arthrobacter sp. PL16 TaxID=3071720 RepID=UPI002E0861F6|nr:hypothetical protein [Arthrobacter sp. PL16]